MIISCKRCGKVWEYKGLNRYSVTCPDCRFINYIAEKPKKELHPDQKGSGDVLQTQNDKEVII